jgi:hypothetical protein
MYKYCVRENASPPKRTRQKTPAYPIGRHVHENPDGFPVFVGNMANYPGADHRIPNHPLDRVSFQEATSGVPLVGSAILPGGFWIPS